MRRPSQGSYCSEVALFSLKRRIWFCNGEKCGTGLRQLVTDIQAKNLKKPLSRGKGAIRKKSVSENISALQKDLLYNKSKLTKNVFENDRYFVELKLINYNY